jgi:anti-sigma-K factor RskA
MHPKLSSRAPWRAGLVAIALLAAAVPVAQASAPESSEKKPYVVILKDRSANAKGVADDHSRRFGVKVKLVYDNGLRG